MTTLPNLEDQELQLITQLIDEGIRSRVTVLANQPGSSEAIAQFSGTAATVQAKLITLLKQGNKNGDNNSDSDD